MATTLEFKNLTKHFGDTHAVNDLSFTVKPGRVTGFLGPNGSGKSTTLRCLTGLIRPTSGQALINGSTYSDLQNPLSIVGSALETSGFHPGRTGYDTLAIIAKAAKISPQRINESLAQVGMDFARDRKVGQYSLGMKQRLALAAALLGDPEVLVLDEPANGLDPEGIAWLRTFVQYRAESGGTVLISSHVLSEVQQTVDDVVIISRGQLVRACSLESLVAETTQHVEITTPDLERFENVLREHASQLRRRNHHILEVEGVPIATVGRLALENSIELHGLSEKKTELEDVFLNLTGNAS